MSFDKITEKAFNLGTTSFHKWYGLVSVLFLLVFISLILYKWIPNDIVLFETYISVVGILALFIVAGWIYYVWRFPKRSKKNLGVAIAVEVEDVEVSKYFQKDFVTPFKSKIRDLDLPFDVLVLRNHQAENVNTVDDARKVLQKTKAQFCIWGSVKKRNKAPTGEKYIFSLRGSVVHAPIQETKKVLLRKEFDQLLPNTLSFEKHLQFEVFEFRANQTVAALDYITGRAALLSGDFNTAIQLHENLLIAIQNGQQYPINQKRLKGLLSLEYDQKASFEYFTSYGNDYIKSVYKSLQFNQNNYGALLKRAIIEFDNGKGDARVAMNTIKNAKRQAPNGAYHWLYSKAFLHFWLEQYSDALKACKKLKRISYPGENFTIQEVIMFNEKLLQKYNKPQLYYWLGYICHVKKNTPLADKYFQQFIDEADDVTMGDLKTRARSYLGNIKKEIGY